MAASKKATYQPRFDFEDNLIANKEQTGTLTELLSELNYENDRAPSGKFAQKVVNRRAAKNKRIGTKKDGRIVETISVESLERTLKFIRLTTGRTFSGTREKLPLSTLKVIKLLYNADDASDRHLFNLLTSPPKVEAKKVEAKKAKAEKAKAEKARATMEFATASSIARDKAAAAIIQRLSDQLAKEIGADKLKSFGDVMRNSGKRSAAEELNAHIERTNDEIYRLLTNRLGSDNIRLANACYRLAKKIDGVGYTKAEDADPSPLNEAIFAHLQGLGFIHFALHHRNFIREIRVSQTIHPIDNEVNALCQSLRDAKGATILPDAEIFSVNNFHHLVAGYHREFISLVRAATKLDVAKNRLFENTLRARRILASHVYRRYDETDLDAPRLSVLDIAAALCSVQYQQEVRTKYHPFWPGQASKGHSPQVHFDKPIDPDDPYKHQGVFQIYFYRFSEYLDAFTKRTESNAAWMAYQLSRFDVYTRILQLNDISSIVASAHHFDEICMQEAMNIADIHSASAV